MDSLNIEGTTYLQWIGDLIFKWQKPNWGLSNCPALCTALLTETWQLDLEDARAEAEVIFTFGSRITLFPLSQSSLHAKNGRN